MILYKQYDFILGDVVGECMGRCILTVAQNA